MKSTKSTTSAASDPAIVQKGYTRPELLVSTAWLADHMDDPNIRIIESDEDVLLYDTGHIPGAQKIDWHEDLNDPVVRDYVSREQFQELLRRKGIDESTTIIFYGDKNNLWAAYDYWVFQLFGFTNAKLPDGVRIKYQGKPLVDVRSPDEYSGVRTHMPEYPQEGTLRGGHIRGAVSVPWARAANPDGTFKSAEELRAIYEKEQGLKPTDDVIAYCRIGERSSHTWFVLTNLLGFGKVRNYDGSWTEWGNAVKAPIEKGAPA